VLARFASCAWHVRVLELVAGIVCGARERDSTPAQLHDDEQPLPVADSPNCSPVST
jgi:hypothetical protein